MPTSCTSKHNRTSAQRSVVDFNLLLPLSLFICSITLLLASQDASKFLPRLQPGVERIERTAADPELRDVAAAALAVLNRVGAEAVQQEEEAERVTQEVRGAGFLKCSVWVALYSYSGSLAVLLEAEHVVRNICQLSAYYF